MVFKVGLQLFLRYWIPLLGYACVILFLSSRPAPAFPRWDIPDKIVHTAEYSLLGLLLIRLLSRELQWKGRKLWITTLFGVAIFGLADETLQSFIPSRHFEIFDIMADLGGRPDRRNQLLSHPLALG